MSISVLAIGSELLDGRVLDTNSQFIAQELNKVGLCLDKIVTCDDEEKEIVASLNFLARSSRCIIVSGGLGPTSDDLTRDAIASFIGQPLERDAQAVERLKKLYEARKRILDASNEKQAYFPHGSQIIKNEVGTAEGFYVEKDALCVFSVPGVPKELQPMLRQVVFPEILRRHPGGTTTHRAPLRIFGLPESLVGSKISALNLPNDFFVSYRATFPEIHVVIKHADSLKLADVVPAVRNAIGKEFIFIEDEATSFSESVSALLKGSGKSVSVAESCTGGMLGAQLTAVPGSSSYFLGGILSYSNRVKEESLGVSPKTLEKFGAVSFETAREMASGVRRSLSSDYGISITGIAGPDGGSSDKPVGTFFIGIADNQESVSYQFFFKADRAGVRRFATYAALDVLRRKILCIPVWDYSTQTHLDPK